MKYRSIGWSILWHLWSPLFGPVWPIKDVSNRTGYGCPVWPWFELNWSRLDGPKGFLGCCFDSLINSEFLKMDLDPSQPSNLNFWPLMLDVSLIYIKIWALLSIKPIKVFNGYIGDMSTRILIVISLINIGLIKIVWIDLNLPSSAVVMYRLEGD